jgi:dihydrofolate reductase
MAKLIYSATTSLDGYTADKDGSIGWTSPEPEVLACINDLVRGVGTFLFGRRMYETMLYWETFEAAEDEPAGSVDFAGIWRGADKVVYSRTLGETTSARTTLQRTFDPESVRRMKATSGHDIGIGGAELAGQAMAAGLVDDVHLFLVPVTLGAGTPALAAGFSAKPELRSVDRLARDVVHLHYRTGT